jgi:hypothetical protein
MIKTIKIDVDKPLKIEYIFIIKIDIDKTVDLNGINKDKHR